MHSHSYQDKKVLRLIPVVLKVPVRGIPTTAHPERKAPLRQMCVSGKGACVDTQSAF